MAFGVALLIVVFSSSEGGQGTPSALSPQRLAQNPLITVRSSTTLGGNVNGPTVIRVATWVEHPMGKCYMYFANHMGDFVRLAYADTVTGPWTIYEPGVLHARDTAFFQQQPDPVETLDLPNAPSEAGDINEPARQIRDPFIFEDAGKTYLFYASCGEQGIAAARIHIP